MLDLVEHLFAEHHIQVGKPSVLRNVDGLLLLPHPAFAKTHAEAVHCVIPVGVNKVHWVHVGELIVVNIRYRRWKPHAVHTPHLNTGRVEITSEVLGVLPHVPGTNKGIRGL